SVTSSTVRSSKPSHLEAHNDRQHAHPRKRSSSHTVAASPGRRPGRNGASRCASRGAGPIRKCPCQPLGLLSDRLAWKLLLLLDQRGAQGMRLGGLDDCVLGSTTTP